MPASLHTPIIRSIASDIFLTILPMLFICLDFAPDVAFIIAATNSPNAVMNATPLSISPGVSIPTNLHTKAIINNDVANLRIIFPALSMFLAAFPLTSNPYAAKNAPISITNAVSPINPAIACSGSILPIIFTVAASNSSARPSDTRAVFNPSNEILPSPILIDAVSNLPIAHAKAVSTPAKMTIVVTAPASLSVSTNVRAITAPTKIAIDSAIFLRALALMF